MNTFMIKFHTQNFFTRILSVLLLICGYRFSKYHRHNETLVYRLLSTTLANIYADTYVMRLDALVEPKRKPLDGCGLSDRLNRP